MNMNRKVRALAFAAFLIISVFMIAGCSQVGPTPAAASEDAASRATGSGLNSLASYLTYQGSDVMLPIMHWYYTVNATAPAGYRYRLVYSYYSDWYDTSLTDGWYSAGTVTCTSLANGGTSHLYPSSTPAAWVKGRVQAYLVRTSTGASTYLGTVTQAAATWVQVQSD